MARAEHSRELPVAHKLCQALALAATMYQHVPPCTKLLPPCTKYCCHLVPSRAQIVPPLPVPGATWMGKAYIQKAENAKIRVTILRNTMLTLLHKYFVILHANKDGLPNNPVRLERGKSVYLKLRRGADTRVWFNKNVSLI